MAQVILCFQLKPHHSSTGRKQILILCLYALKQCTYHNWIGTSYGVKLVNSSSNILSLTTLCLKLNLMGTTKGVNFISNTNTLNELQVMG